MKKLAALLALGLIAMNITATPVAAEDHSDDDCTECRACHSCDDCDDRSEDDTEE